MLEIIPAIIDVWLVRPVASLEGSIWLLEPIIARWTSLLWRGAGRMWVRGCKAQRFVLIGSECWGSQPRTSPRPLSTGAPSVKEQRLQLLIAFFDEAITLAGDSGRIVCTHHKDVLIHLCPDLGILKAAWPSHIMVLTKQCNLADRTTMHCRCAHKRWRSYYCRVCFKRFWWHLHDCVHALIWLEVAVWIKLCVIHRAVWHWIKKKKSAAHQGTSTIEKQQMGGQLIVCSVADN